MADCAHCGDEFYSEGPYNILCGRCFEVAQLKVENQRLREGRREAAQTLIAEIGANKPEDIEDTAKRAVGETQRLKAENERLHGQVDSAEVYNNSLTAENERLKEELVNMGARAGQYCGSCMYLEIENMEMLERVEDLKAENERLKEEQISIGRQPGICTRCDSGITSAEGVCPYCDRIEEVL